MTDLATGRVLREMAETLADEHGYRGQRDGHAIEACATCRIIQQGRNQAAALGVGEFDDEPWYEEETEESLRERVIELALLPDNDDTADCTHEALVAVLRQHYHPR